MPYINQEVEAEVLIEYKGFTVYYTYSHGEFNDPTSNFYSFSSDDDDPEFDVRDLHNFGVKLGTPEYRKPEFHTREYHADVIREAIEHGHLDDVIQETGLETLKEQEWTQDIEHLAKWQLIEIIKAYNNYLLTANTDDQYTVTEYYQKIYRKEKIK